MENPFRPDYQKADAWRIEFVSHYTHNINPVAICRAGIRILL